MYRKILFLLNLVFLLNATVWTIDAGNYFYEPDYLEIEVGDTVEWNNVGGFHDVVVTSGPEQFSTSACMGPCDIGSYTFILPGQYDYICSIGSHAQLGMVGTIVVVSSSLSGCTDPNAITCEDEIDTLYFPECDTCSDDNPCDNYYNPYADEDNGLCMYNDIPSYDEFTIDYYDVSIDGTSGYLLDWSAFTPPVDITQYALQRCVDFDGDSDGDGELEYDVCNMIIPPNSFYLDTNYSDSYTLDDGAFLKYTLYVHYPNNNYWGSAQGYYYYEPDSCDLSSGDVNEDGILNVIDIVNLVNYILGSGSLTDCQLEAADMNSDSIINVIDIVNLVNIILN